MEPRIPVRPVLERELSHASCQREHGQVLAVPVVHLPTRVEHHLKKKKTLGGCVYLEGAFFWV